ncbi:unnamed protein product, partial [Symbiodinium sp. CCMP2456]
MVSKFMTWHASGMSNRSACDAEHPELDTHNVELLRDWCERNLNVDEARIDPYLPRQDQAGQAPDRARLKAVLKEMNDAARTCVRKLKAMKKPEATEKAMKLFKTLRIRVQKGLGNHPELDNRNVELLRDWCE